MQGKIRMILSIIIGVTLWFILYKFTESPSYKRSKIICLLWKRSDELTGDVEFLELTIGGLERRIEKLEAKLKEE